MKRIILIIIIILFPCFAQSENRSGPLFDFKDSIYDFSESSFCIRSTSDYETIKIRYKSKNYNKEFSLKCDSYVEQLTIKKVNEEIYWFCCESLGFQQYFIWNQTTDKIYEPFFDLKKSVYISRIDYKNQVLFGDNWNSDKDVMPNSKVELYLFSTAKQTHFKIEEKYGEVFSITLLDNNKIQYNDKNGNLVQYDYSEWIMKENEYIVSSFLVEGKTFYKAENLASVEGLPWASANGYGINDTIKLRFLAKSDSKLIFYNGFQSKSRPDLFKANSRVKKIEIKNLENEKVSNFLLQDIIDAQKISLSALNIQKDEYITLEIKILEVYQGEKYKDLCIQAIIPE